MLYQIYDFHQTALVPWRVLGDLTRSFISHPFVPASYTHFGRSVAAGLEVMEAATRQRGKPEWGVASVVVDGEAQSVSRHVVSRLPFCELARFRREGASPDDPKVLLAAPMSGHHATLLRGTVEALVADHEVYVTDWIDARGVAVEDGAFGIEDYIGYLLKFLRKLGPDLHVIAVCQPAPLVLSAVALLAAARDPAQPRTMTLMGGPVDPAAAPTRVTELADTRSLDWFEKSVLTRVPAYYPGAGRRVYPGFLQLGGFISMNASRHFDAHLKMFRHLVQGDGDSADAHRRFYDEYLAVMDVPAEYYLETIDRVFQRRLLPSGEMTWRGLPVEPSAIERTALLTVEGELDDISAPGQTLAAHALCDGLASSQKHDLLQKGVGHYGIFNGRRWREGIKPAIGDFIRRYG